MRLKNVLIVVKDIERSRQFYHDLFGLEMILDNDGNMILTEGLVLQEEKYWKEFLGKEIIPENNSCELYFEERDIEGFIEKLERYYPDVKYVYASMIRMEISSKWGRQCRMANTITGIRIVLSIATSVRMRQREMILNSYFAKRDRKRRVLFEKTTQHTGDCRLTREVCWQSNN